jgi:hypothetical protein
VAALTWTRASARHFLTQPRRLVAELSGAAEFLFCWWRGRLLPMDARFAASASNAAWQSSAGAAARRTDPGRPPIDPRGEECDV